MSTNRVVSTIVCLLAFEVIACTLGVSLMLKLFSGDTPHPEDYRQLAFWVRSWGFTLLLVPATWAGAILMLKEGEDAPAAFALTGYSVMAALLLFYAAAFYSATRMPIVQIQE